LKKNRLFSLMPVGFITDTPNNYFHDHVQRRIAFQGRIDSTDGNSTAQQVWSINDF